MRSLTFGGVVLGLTALLGAGFGCTKSSERYPGVNGCDTCAGDKNTSSGIPGTTSATSATSSSSSSNSSSGAGGQSGLQSVSGSLVAVTDENFTITSPFNGKATVSALDHNGKVVQSTYGAGETTFQLDGLNPGINWFFVHDETNGGSGVLSTWSPLDLPAAPPAHLPVLDTMILSQIITTLPNPSVLLVDDQHTNLILEVRRSQQGLAGVTLDLNKTSLGIGGTVVYDAGSGAYDDKGPTGTRGVILILNAPSSATTLFSTVFVIDDQGAAFTLPDIPTSGASVTFAAFEI